MSEVEWMFSHDSAEEFYKEDFARTRPNDAGIDLRVMEEVCLVGGQCVIGCRSGIRINIKDPGVVGLIVPRSGLGSKGLILGNTVGVIDCGYQSELLLTIWNRSSGYKVLSAGERVAQLLLMPVLHPVLRGVESFEPSERGTSGFGSSGRL